MKAKNLLKKDIYTKFDNEREPLYLETDASGAGLGIRLLRVKDGMTFARDRTSENAILITMVFANKSTSSPETHYSNIEREVLGILHSLHKFHYHCFAREVQITMDHKPLKVIFKKDIATLSQGMKCILLKRHQYKIKILYKQGPDLFIADWLSR